MLKRIFTCYMAGCFALAAVSADSAEPPPRYNTVELQAEAQREVQNDLLNASLFVELNDPSPAALANAINKSVNDALRIAKDYKGVRVRSGNNQTFPVYAKGNVLQGWRGRAEIRIESKDFEAASGLIGKLQAGMQLGQHDLYGLARGPPRHGERVDRRGHRRIQSARRDRQGCARRTWLQTAAPECG